MKIKFQYYDGDTWEDTPDKVAESPDKGVIRMWGKTEDTEVVCVYDDFYYVYPNGDGTFTFGSGTNQREFTLIPGKLGIPGQERFKLPVGATVRLGKQVNQEEAVAFGLIDEGGKLLSEKATVYVEIASD